MDQAINPSGSKPPLDVGILIALEEEFQELAPQIKKRSFYNPDIKQYYYLFESATADAEGRPYRCVVTFIGRMGPTEAGVAGDRLMEKFKPTTIVSIGIAGSMDSDVLVGDVVVADQTDEYLASSKAVETSDKQDWDIQFSGDPYKSDPAYVEHAANLKYAHSEAAQNWENACQRKLMELVGTVAGAELARQNLVRATPKLHMGHIASGPIVGGASTFVKWLKDKRDRKYLALEMESAAVLKAAHKRGANSLIIRGISDYSDERKVELDKIGGGALRRYAMNNALSLLWVLMDLQLIYF
jgi:nucleoside phosphorylase